ncbi:MAG: NAD-dependent epimerase/dehydratase family protein [Bacteroidota bacterium]
MILLTGASGFLGKTLTAFFKNEELITLGRSSGNIRVDLSMAIPQLPASDLIIHAAGKAHLVPKTAQEKEAFYAANVTGTQNLLLGLERAPNLPSAFVFISSVAVYGLESGTLITEAAPLLATDAYGQSKIAAEKLISAWCAKHQIICTILRLPLVAAPNPPGNLGAMVKAIKRGYYFEIAESNSKKSVVLAKDVAQIIPLVSTIGGIYNLTDGYHPSFKELSTLIAQQLNKAKPPLVPLALVKAIARVGDIFGIRAIINTKKLNKITSSLTFDDALAKTKLEWNPTPVLDEFKSVP